MPIIDSQIHAYEANTPKRPWHTVPDWPAHAPATRTSRRWTSSASTARSSSRPFRCTRYDASYAVEVQKKHPGRFALVKPVNPEDPAVADVIAEWKKTPGTVGIRIRLPKEKADQTR